MADDKRDGNDTNSDRRGFLSRLSTAAMAAGLVGGYGAFALVAGRFLFPAGRARRQWQFVAEADRLAVGESLLYRTPAGETVNITRKERNGDESDFIALSSTCPHLGCQVHWESRNDRYFCPCHNGTFDPDGVGTGGPPGEAGQVLPRYPLRVEGGLLYIEVRLDRLAAKGRNEVIEPPPLQGPGHDPCLTAKAGERRA